MKIQVNHDFEETYLPPRCRKNRTRKINDGTNIVSFKVLRYKGVLFDEWVEDNYGIWASMCPACVNQYKKRLNIEIDTHGSGSCSVRGCWNEDSDDIGARYINFDYSEIEVFEETLSESIEKLKTLGMTLDGISQELDWRENAGDKGPGGWDDTLCEYTTEELEAIEERWLSKESA